MAITEKYKVLGQYGVQYYEVEKVKLFIGGIKNSKKMIQIVISTCW